MEKTNTVTKTMKTKQVTSSKIGFITKVGMLAAIATVLMLFEIPIPFIAPSFYELDLSEVPVLIGAFAMGPVAGIVVEFIKILINLVVNGTDTAFVGEIGNFIVGCALVVPAGMIYKINKTRKHAIVGLITGTISMAVIGCFMNAYVLLPAYAKAFGMPIDAFVQMGTAIHSSITNIFTFVVLAVAPFNILKGLAVSIVTLLLYKHISRLLKA